MFKIEVKCTLNYRLISSKFIRLSWSLANQAGNVFTLHNCINTEHYRENEADKQNCHCVLTIIEPVDG